MRHGVVKSRKRRVAKAKAAQAAAERTLQDRAMLTLSARETEAFVETILNPAAPGRGLRAAARHYKRSVGR